MDPLKFDIAWSNAFCPTLQRGVIQAACRAVARP